MASDMDLTVLISMGFDPRVASEALVASRNNGINAAIEAILSDPRSAAKPPPVANSTINKGRPTLSNQNKKPELLFDPANIDQHPALVNKEFKGERLKQYKFSEEPDEDFIYDGNTSSLSTQAGSNFKCHDERKLIGTVLGKISSMMDLTDYDFAYAAMLLHHFKWDTEKLTERYFEDPDRILQTLNIAAPPSEPPCFSGGDCLICIEPLQRSNSSISSCGHSFCNSCWKEYLDLEIKEGKAIGIRCMGDKCKGLLASNFIKNIVDEDSYCKYVEFMTRQFVDGNPNMKWCPAPRCNFAIESELVTEYLVPCNCGFKFCFVCSAEAHAPANCEQMGTWEKKCKDDSETVNWIQSYTEQCPQCKAAIEKNGGCNHMHCKRCNFHFCWICKCPMTGHKNCNKYNPSGESHTGSNRSLNRYLHYYHRWKAHMDSQLHETNLRKIAVAKMIEMRKCNFHNVEFLSEATEQLIECRRTLKHTYIFAYYLADKSAEKNLFEWLQEELEQTTEKLSGLLEHGGTSETLKQNKQIVDVTKLAQTRLEHLLEGVKDGLIAGAQFVPDGKISESKVSTKKQKSFGRGKKK